MSRRLLYRAFSLLGRKHARNFAAATADFRAAQFKLLQNILTANTQSAFGREHNFTALKTIEDFQRALPVRDYDGFKPYVQRALQGQPAVLTAEAPFMFATTSGTSAEPKYIPVTRRYIKEFRQASVISGYHLFHDYPGIAGGFVFSVASPATEGLTPGGVPYGAISGLLFKEEPWFMRKFVSPIPYEAYLIRDYESRWYTLARLALQLPLSCLYTLNPSTIKMLLSKLNQYAPQLIDDLQQGTITPPQKLPPEIAATLKPFASSAPAGAGGNHARAQQLRALLKARQFTPRRIWPELQVVSCWTKAAAAFYLEELKQAFDGIAVEDISYGASEGRGTVYGGNGKQVLAITSHFFEFIPEEEIESSAPTILLGCDLEVGKNYYILFTTSAGLYRYHINDVVKVTGFEGQAPLLEFQYKGGNICSFTGEKITELQVVQAMGAALQKLRLQANFFTLIPRFDTLPYYELWIELPAGSGALPAQAAANTDENLQHINIEYKAKRESGRLGYMQARLLTPGSYELLRKHLCAQQAADAQIKVSHLNPKPAVTEFLTAQLAGSSLAQ